MALFTVAELWNHTRCPLMDDWMKKMWCIYTMDYLAIQKNEIMLFARKWEELDIVK
jgi:hypothetical protein